MVSRLWARGLSCTSAERVGASVFLRPCSVVCVWQCVQNQWTLQEPVHVQVRPGELMPSQLQHGYLVCPDDEPSRKLAGLRSLLRKFWKDLRACIVFAPTDDDAFDIADGIGPTVKKLMAAAEEEGGSPDAAAEQGGEVEEGEDKVVQVLSRADNIKRRADIMEDFRAGRCRVLVTTDFASRGLDIPEVRVRG